jgi:hypothetical protein
LGVTIVRNDYSKPLAKPQEVQVIEHVPAITDAVVAEIADAADAVAEPMADADDVQVQVDAVQPEPKPTPPSASPVETPTRNRPLSDLERDLLSRLKSPPGSAERMAPPPRVSPRNGDDYDKNRTGHGVDPAALGGHKMA